MNKIYNYEFQIINKNIKTANLHNIFFLYLSQN